MKRSTANVRPPNSPWIRIPESGQCSGYLSFYYSDDLSGLPVRWITKPGDNKSDPNVETGTYGLFSTCGRSMRSSVVKHGHSAIFFITRKKGVRVLAGYYGLGWYAKMSPSSNDFCLAAERVHFVEKPVSLIDVDRKLGTDFAKPSRSPRLVGETDCVRLKSLLEKQPSALSLYLSEIDRLERFNFHHGEFRYIGWRQSEGFSWDIAKSYLKLATKGSKEFVSTESPSGKWKCKNCEAIIANARLLRKCPECGHGNVLSPLAVSRVNKKKEKR